MGYRHTQVGWTTLVIVGALVAFLGVLAADTPGATRAILLAVEAMLVVVMVLFGSLTVDVDATHLELRFGPGPVQRRVPFVEIESVGRYRLPWWAVGFGVRMSLDGKRQLWRPSGRETVDLRLAGDRRLLISSDEPDALETVLRTMVPSANQPGGS
ncbi:MAG: hypothetical protein ACHQDE_05310 [Acidimicrobiia bacterium]